MLTGRLPIGKVWGGEGRGSGVEGQIPRHSTLITRPYVPFGSVIVKVLP